MGKVSVGRKHNVVVVSEGMLREGRKGMCGWKDRCSEGSMR